MQLMTETCELLLRGESTEYDEYGVPVPAEPRRESWACWYEPRGSSEAVVAQEQQIDGLWIYLPLDAPVGAADAVIVAGARYEVEGEPGRQPGGFITPGFVKAALGRVRG